MNIQTCKVKDGGYLVNGIDKVPNDQLNSDYQAVQQWIADGNAPEPEYTAQELAAKDDAERMSKSVTMRQARLALLQAGLLPQIETAIQALSEPDKTSVQIEWEYALDVKRSHAWVITLAQQIGLTEQQLDNLFYTAETI